MQQESCFHHNTILFLTLVRIMASIACVTHVCVSQRNSEKNVLFLHVIEHAHYKFLCPNILTGHWTSLVAFTRHTSSSNETWSYWTSLQIVTISCALNFASHVCTKLIIVETKITQHHFIENAWINCLNNSSK